LPASRHPAATRSGADDLSGTLDKLTDTADDARPAVRALDPLLRKLDPTLHDLRELLGDLRPLLEDAKPLVKELVPTVDSATDVLHDLNGTVLDRINGPILGTLAQRMARPVAEVPQRRPVTGTRSTRSWATCCATSTSGGSTRNATAHLLGSRPAPDPPRSTATGYDRPAVADLLSEDTARRTASR